MSVLIGLVFTAGRLIKGKAQPTIYQTAKVEKGTIISTVSASGQIISTNIVNVTTQASGVVKKVYVQDGAQVSAGQKMVELTLDSAGQQKNAAAWSSYLSAKNSFESAKATLYSLDSQMWSANQKFINDAVARGLATNDPTYIQEHDDWFSAEAKYKNQQQVITQAQASVNSVWLSYQQSSPMVAAPISGTILGLSVAEGMVLSSSSSSDSVSSQKVAVIQNPANPLGTFNISEIDVPRIKAGQKATVILDSLLGKTFTGKLVAIDRTGTVTSGVTNYAAIIQLDTTSAEILPNMAASANIIVDSKNNVLLVPSSAIQNINGETVVRALRDGEEQSLPVETGLSSDTQTEIISGLNEGEEVISGTVSSTSSQGNNGSVFSGGGFGGAFRSGGMGGGTRRD